MRLRLSRVVFLLALAALGAARAADAQAVKIYWTERGSDTIRCADPDGANTQTLVTLSDVDPTGIALDQTVGRMFWTNRLGQTVQRANLDGSSVQSIISGLSLPVDIAMNSLNGTLQFNDLLDVKVRRANTDGTGLTDVLTSGIAGPRGIALDLAAGKMYLTDKLSSGTVGKILRANLDGSSLTTLYSATGALPQDIDLDPVAGKMYWTDWNLNLLRRANLDGTGVEDLLTVENPYGIAVDPVGGKMYWTQTEFYLDGQNNPHYFGGSIRRADLDGSNLEVLQTDVNDPRGIALEFVVPEPATVSLLALGAVLVAARRRRRR